MRRSRDIDELPPEEVIAAADSESPKADRGLGRGVVMVAFVAVTTVIALVAGAYFLNRAYPPPSPPDTQTQQRLEELEEYIRGPAKAKRDAQYAQTVYALCRLAASVNDAQLLDQYDCPDVLSGPVPTAPSTTAAPSSSSPSSSRSASPGATPTVTATTFVTPSGVSSAVPAPVPSATPTPVTPSSPAASPAVTPLLPGVLCSGPLPVSICIGGSS